MKRVTQLLHESQADNEELQSKYNVLEKQLKNALSDAVGEAEGLGKVFLGAKKELEQSRKDTRKLKAQKSEVQKITKAYRKKAKGAKIYKATCKGIYTPEMCSLALFLVEVGCSRDYVGEVIEHVFNTAGISVKGSMSG